MIPFISTGSIQDGTGEVRVNMDESPFADHRNAFMIRLVETPQQRRERIATAVLAGMWSNPNILKLHMSCDPMDAAIKEADALIAKLDNGVAV